MTSTDDNTAALNTTQTITDVPRHFWFLAKDKIYDRLHFRTAFDYDQTTNPPIHDNKSNPSDPTFPSLELQIWYPAWKDSTRVKIIWKPLKYVDGTKYNKDRGTSLSRSGSYILGFTRRLDKNKTLLQCFSVGSSPYH